LAVLRHTGPQKFPLPVVEGRRIGGVEKGVGQGKGKDEEQGPESRDIKRASGCHKKIIKSKEGRGKSGEGRVKSEE
jgi:hypothetical protein